MNVLLIDPPSLEGFAIEGAGERKLPTPNMGLIYIASYLKLKTDANVLVLDMPAYNIAFQGIGNIIKDFNPSLVGISSKTFNILSAYNLA